MEDRPKTTRSRAGVNWLPVARRKGINGGGGVTGVKRGRTAVVGIQMGDDETRKDARANRRAVDSLADELSKDLNVWSAAGGVLEQSMSLNNARKQNRGEQRRLHVRLKDMNDRLVSVQDRITDRQSIIVDELLLCSPKTENKVILIMRENRKTLRKLGLPRTREAQKILQQYQRSHQISSVTKEKKEKETLMQEKISYLSRGGAQLKLEGYKVLHSREIANIPRMRLQQQRSVDNDMPNLKMTHTPLLPRELVNIL